MSVTSETRKISIVTIIQYLAIGFYIFIIPALFGPENYGVLVIVTTSTGIFSLISDLGITITIYRYVPQHAALGQEGKIRGLIHRCNIIRLLTITPFIVLWIGFFSLLGFNIFIIASGVAIFCGMAFVNFLFSIAYGHGRSGWFTSKNAARAVLRLLFLFVGFTVLGLEGAIFSLVLVESLLIIMGLGLVRGDLFGEKEPVHISSYMRKASQFWIYDLLFPLYHALSIYITQFFTISYTQVGYYSFGMDFGRFMAMFLSSIGIAALPIIIELMTDGEKQRVTLLVARATKYLAVIAPVIMLWVIFLVPLVITLIVPSYLISISIAQISLLWVFPIGLSTIFSGVVIAKEKPIIVIKARVLSLTFFLSTAFLIGPFTGITGIAWVYTAGQIVEAASTTGMASREFELEFPKRTVLVSTTIATIIGLTIFLLTPPISIPIIILIPFTPVYIKIWVPLFLIHLVLATPIYLVLLIATKALTINEFREITFAIFPIKRKRKS